MILSFKSVTTVRDPRKARVQSPDMQRCGEEGGLGEGGGDKDKDRGAGCISEQCSASECTHPAGQQDVWCAQLHHHCSLPLARVLKNNLLVPKKNCLEGSTSEFCFPLISPPPASLCNPSGTQFFYQQTKQCYPLYCTQNTLFLLSEVLPHFWAYELFAAPRTQPAGHFIKTHCIFGPLSQPRVRRTVARHSNPFLPDHNSQLGIE